MLAALWGCTCRNADLGAILTLVCPHADNDSDDVSDVTTMNVTHVRRLGLAC